MKNSKKLISGYLLAFSLFSVFPTAMASKREAEAAIEMDEALASKRAKFEEATARCKEAQTVAVNAAKIFYTKRNQSIIDKIKANPNNISLIDTVDMPDSFDFWVIKHLAKGLPLPRDIKIILTYTDKKLTLGFITISYLPIFSLESKYEFSGLVANSEGVRKWVKYLLELYQKEPDHFDLTKA